MRNRFHSFRPYFTYAVMLAFLVVILFAVDKKPIEVRSVVPEVVKDTPVRKKPSVIPDFASIADVNTKKKAFFDFLDPFVTRANDEILRQREVLLDMKSKLRSGVELKANDKALLDTLSEMYELTGNYRNPVEKIDDLLFRADIIPKSLTLAQAANESAWGTSRFAQDGNNLFGHWCYSKGCGLVPNRRGADATYEVRYFESVMDSVRAYMNNLNTFPTYSLLRQIRKSLRDEGKKIDGVSLADGLESYSARGLDYIAELQSIIYSNRLLRQDRNISESR